MRRPLVSVVIPCHNQGRFLGEAIDSALRQTCSSIEVIVVDDGSTDDTASAARRFNAVRLIEQRRRGAGAARTIGLQQSKGEYIVFLDADDRLLPDAAAIGVEWLDAHADWAFVTGHVRLIDEDGSPAGVPPQDHANGNRYIALLRSNYIWTPGAVLYRRSVLEAVGPFDPSSGASQDYELNLRIARRHAFGCHHRLVLEYRRHRANMSADAGYMLKSAVSVRRAQQKYLRNDRAALAALKEGIEIVQADYGGRLIEQTKSDLRTPGRRRRAFGAMICLARFYRAGLRQILTDAARLLAWGSRRNLPANSDAPRA